MSFLRFYFKPLLQMQHVKAGDGAAVRETATLAADQGQCWSL